MKKKMFYLLIALMLGISTYNTTTYAATIVTSIEPQADIIEWRYKIEDNKLYRRQYNRTKREWIGEWEFIANVS